MNDRIYQAWNHFRVTEFESLNNLRGVRRSFQAAQERIKKKEKMF